MSQAGLEGEWSGEGGASAQAWRPEGAWGVGRTGVRVAGVQAGVGSRRDSKGSVLLEWPASFRKGSGLTLDSFPLHTPSPRHVCS